jgi:hypothetical protein
VTALFAVRLPQHQARIVALAVSYHLARPGAEIDRDTMQEYEHGLRELLPVLDGQLDDPTAQFSLTPLQSVLLATAFSSVISELKMYSLLDTMSGASSRPRSSAPGFDERLRALFPQVAADPTQATALADDMLMLRRSLPFARGKELREQELEDRATKSRGREKRWQFWRRT